MHFLNFLFIFVCTGSSLLCRGVGFSFHWLSSCYGAQALGTWASIVAMHGLSNCDLQTLELAGSRVWAQLLHGMWTLPGPGMEPVSPTLAGDSLPLHHQRSP